MVKRQSECPAHAALEFRIARMRRQLALFESQAAAVVDLRNDDVHLGSPRVNWTDELCDLIIDEVTVYKRAGCTVKWGKIKASHPLFSEIDSTRIREKYDNLIKRVGSRRKPCGTKSTPVSL